MLLPDLIRWWYTKGYQNLFYGIGSTIRRINLALSVPILIQTLFSPWRRIISYGGKSIADQMRAMLDNLISRLVGLVVRSLVLFVALLGTVVVVVGGVILLVAWPLTPLIALILIVKGIARG